MIKTIRIISGKDSKLLAPLLLTIVNLIFNGSRYGILCLVLIELLKPLNQIDIRKIILYFGLMLICLIINLLISIVVHKKSFITAYNLSANARLNLAEHLKKLPLGFFKKRDPGDITSLLLQDMAKVEMIFSHCIIDFIASIVSPLIMISFFFFADWRMACIALAAIPIALPVLFIGQKIVSTLGKKHMNTKNNATSRLLEYIQGIKVLKSFNLTGTKFKRLDDTLKELRKDSVRLESGAGGPIQIYMGILEMGFIGIIWLGIYFLFQGTIQIPVLIIFLVIGYKFFEPIQYIAAFLSELRYMNIAATRVSSVLNEKPLPEPDNRKNVENYNITFKNVTFKYYNKNVLQNINLEIPRTSFTALVGPSGSGKTTLTNLIARFWDPNSGDIFIGNENLKKIKTEDLYKHISMVFQDVYLFQDTIYNNIKLGNPKATEEQVIQAAKDAHCYDFIMEREKGFETILGESGSTLSGGEKQRISIARAILKDANIILLDEATASLDPENELLIQQSISKLIKNKTLIVIAHRLNTIIHANQIVVFEAGKIIELGTHKSLLDNKKLYHKLWNDQQISRGWEFA